MDDCFFSTKSYLQGSKYMKNKTIPLVVVPSFVVPLELLLDVAVLGDGLLPSRRTG